MYASGNDLDSIVNQGPSLVHQTSDHSLLFAESTSRLDEVDNDFRTQLHHAVLNASEERVRELLGQGASVDKRDRLTYEPLHHAVVKGSTSIIKLLLDSGADPASKVYMDQTPLHLAVLKKVPLKDLLQARSGVNNQDKQGRTPLNLLLSTRHLDGPSREEIELLLRAGADINLANNAGDTSFHLLLDQEYSDSSPLIYDTILLFLKNGADTSRFRRNGQTALEIYLNKSRGAWAASKPGHAYCEQAHACLFGLMRRFARISVAGPSGELIAHEYLQQCSRLLPHGKQVIKKFASTAALDKRGQKGNYLIHELLRLVNERDCADFEGGHLRVLLNRGGDPNIRNKLGQSPVMIMMDIENRFNSSSVKETKRMLRILLEGGGSVWIRDNAGRLPIYKAMLNFQDGDRYGMAKLLLFTDDKGISPRPFDHTAVSREDSSWWQAWGLATVSDDWEAHEKVLKTAKASLPDDVRNILYPIMMRLLAENHLEKARTKCSTNQIPVREHRRFVATVVKGMVQAEAPITYSLIGHLVDLVLDE